MLTARIINTNGQTAEYVEEFDDFSWLTVNNEGATFSASVPDLTATVRLNVVDNFLKSLKRGARIEVSSDVEDVADSLTLILSVLEVATLPDKGYTEIGCSGAFLAQMNSIWGTLHIDGDTWAHTQGKYGLQAVENHEDNNSCYAHAYSKEDILLAIAWSYETRRNIAVTPFTTGDTNFKAAGYGLFKNVKETGAVDVYAPVYRIDADYIIDYDISPTQQPVTHIAGTTLGKEQMSPTVPEVDIDLEGSSRDVGIDATGSYFISQLGVGAISYLTIARSDDEGAEEPVLAYIKWSDGVISDVNDGVESGDFVIGITPNAYVLVGSDYRTVYVCDRVTGEVISQATAPVDLDALELPRFEPVSEVYLTNDNESGTVIMFNETIAIPDTTTLLVGIVVLDNNTIRFLVAEDIEPAGETWKYSSSAYRTVEGSENAAKGMYTSNYSASRYAVCEATAKLSGQVQLEHKATYLESRTRQIHFMDYIADSQGEHILLRSRSVAAHQSDVILRTYVDEVETVSIIVAQRMDNAQLIFDSSIEKPTLDDCYILVHNDEVWKLIKVVDGEPLVLQEGLISQWVGGQEYFELALTRGAVTVVVFPNGDTQQTAKMYLQLGPVPFLTREETQVLTAQQIAQGTRNEVDLMFKVGAISQLDSNKWDTDKGRIEIELARFKVRNNTTLRWIEKNVQALNVMAVGAYARVQLVPDVEEYITIKIIGFSLSYTGVVTAKVTGIIVE